MYIYDVIRLLYNIFEGTLWTLQPAFGQKSSNMSVNKIEC